MIKESHEKHDTIDKIIGIVQFRGQRLGKGAGLQFACITVQLCFKLLEMFLLVLLVK